MFGKGFLSGELSSVSEGSRTETTHADTQFSEKRGGDTLQNSHFPSACGETPGHVQPVEEPALEHGP